MPRLPMFISLKWKALIFLNLVLSLMTIAWISQNVYETVASFNQESEEVHLANQRSFNQLLVDRTVQLTQLSLLFSENPLITNASAAASDSSALGEFIHNKWFSLNINIELDYFAVYDAHGNTLSEESSGQHFSHLNKVRDLIERYIPLAHTQGPQSFIFCENSCALFAIEPFLFSDSSEGYVIIAQNIANIVHRYNKFTGSDLAILIENATSAKGLDSSRYLDEWQASIWAISNFDSSVIKLTKHSEHATLTEHQHSDSRTGDKQGIKFSRLATPSHPIYGQKAHFIDINDESESLAHLNESITRGVITGIVGLFIASLISMAIMFGPLKRLSNVAKALRLLPRRQYKDALATIERKPNKTRDELTTLEDSTYYSANKLRQLHQDVEAKNDELEQQLLALSRSRNFLSQLFDSPHLFILTMNEDLDILTSNKLFESVRRKEYSNYLTMLSGKNKHILADKLANFLQSQQTIVRFAFELHDADDEVVYIAWSFTRVEDEVGNQVILAVGTDLSERRKAESALEWLVHHDSLTKLGNRRAID